MSAAICLVLVFLIMPDAGLAQQANEETAKPPADTAPADTAPVESLPGISTSEIEQIRSTLSVDQENEAAGGLGDLGAEETAKTPFRIGIIPRGDSARFLKYLEPVQRGLADVLGKPVEILPMATFSAMIDAHTLRRIDLGFYSSSAFATANRLCRCLEPLVVPLAVDGTSSYYALVVTRQGSGLRELADLEGKRIATSSFDSVAGYRVQMASMIRAGIDVGTFFGEVNSVGSSVEALRHVRDGLADAAFIWSSMSGEQSAGYTRGPLAYLVRSREIEMSEISIVWQSKPIAHAPVAVSKSLPAQERETVRTFLLAMPESDTATYDFLDVYYGGGYKAAEIADFRGVSILADVDLRSLDKAASPIAPRSSGAPLSEQIAPLPRQRPDPAPLIQQNPGVQ